MTRQRIFLGTLIVATAALLVTRVGIGGRTAYAATVRAPDRAGVADSRLFATKQAPSTPVQTELAAFAAGCFWGVEEEFRKQKGVVATAVGYMGGHTKNPSYEAVCTGATGHAETVEVEYDPKVVSYDQLLELFWDLHDPTTPNRQGPDSGSQYRAAIFFFTAEQEAGARASKGRIQSSGELSAPVVTEIEAASTFTRAEAYHQQYVENGGRAACHRRKRPA